MTNTLGEQGARPGPLVGLVDKAILTPGEVAGKGNVAVARTRPGAGVTIFVQIGLVVLVGLASKNAILIVEFAKPRQVPLLCARKAPMTRFVSEWANTFLRASSNSASERARSGASSMPAWISTG
jgi:hypothetical protein